MVIINYRNMHCLVQKEESVVLKIPNVNIQLIKINELQNL